MKNKNKNIKTNIDRLLLYRKILKNQIDCGVKHIYSHNLAAMAEITPTLVRRDLMAIGYYGSPAHGYDTSILEASLTHYLGLQKGLKFAIIGLGKLGQSILDYCLQHNTNILQVILFDIDPEKIGQVFHGGRCYHVDMLSEMIKTERIEVAVIAVPLPEDAKKIAEILVRSGIKSILNYTPFRMIFNNGVYIENRDMMFALEKAAFFATSN